MVEHGILVNGVPLEEYLIDKEKKKLYDDTQAEIAGQKKLTYKSRGISMTVKHDKRPSKVRHVSRAEYYMKENIAKCQSGGEYVLTIMQDGLPQSPMSLIERMKHWEIKIGSSGVRQALLRVMKRFPDLFDIIKDGRTITYTMIPAACKIDQTDLLNLWNGNISWEQLVEMSLDLRQALTSKVLASEEAARVSLTDVLESLEEWQNTVAAINTKVAQIEHHLGKTQIRVDDLDRKLDSIVDVVFLNPEEGKRPDHGTFDINVNINFGKGGS